MYECIVYRRSLHNFTCGVALRGRHGISAARNSSSVSMASLSLASGYSSLRCASSSVRSGVGSAPAATSTAIAVLTCPIR